MPQVIQNRRESHQRQQKRIYHKNWEQKINPPWKRKLDSEKMDKILLSDKTEGHDEKHILYLTAKDKDRMSMTVSVMWLEQG